MKKHRLLILLAACLASLTTAFAQTAQIKRTWLEYDVTQDGEQGMKIHLEFNVQDMKGTLGKAIAYFEHPKGTGLKDRNGRYTTTNGNVCASTTFRPGYDDTYYENLAFFIPYTELHIRPGERTYYCQVLLENAETNKFFAWGDYVSFTGKSGDDSPAPQQQARRASFPGKATYYYTNAEGTIPLKVDFYYDNDNDAVITTSNTSYHRGILESAGSDGLHFTSFEYQAEFKAAQVTPLGPPLPALSGNLVKKKTGQSLIVSPDYSEVRIINPYTTLVYPVRISESKFKQLNDEYQRFINGVSGGYTGNSGNTGSYDSGNGNNSSRVSMCKYCRGTGNCSSCKGSGHVIHVSPYHDVSDVQTCPSCNGSGRCFNCHGTGRQR